MYCNGTGTNPELNTALGVASYFGLHEIANRLLQNDVDKDIKDGSGNRTPLLLALYEGHVTTAELLLENGVDINAADLDSECILGLSIIMWLTQKQNILS